MEEKIEAIIKTIEESFTKLNTSVDMLKKAEEITTVSTSTTSKLINEFESTISKIETLVKVDFANEYNKLLELQNNLVRQFKDFDFKKSFDDTKKEISSRNYNKEFEFLKSTIEKKEFDEKFKEIFNFVLANNEILNSFQVTINNLPDGLLSLKNEIEQKNFDSNFIELKSRIDNKNFNDKFKDVFTRIQAINFDNNFKTLEIKLDSQQNELKLLKTILILVCGLLMIGMVVTIIFLKKRNFL